MKTEKSNAKLTIIFYVISIIIIVGINVSEKFKTGHCTPNLDLLSIPLLALFSFFLAFFNAILAFGFNKPTKKSFYIHFSVLIFFILIRLILKLVSDN